MNDIKIKNLKKKYGRKTVLEDVSFTLKNPSITGLIGRNGTGKTTLLNLLNGFIRPTSGEMDVFGEEPFDSLLVSGNSIFIDDRMQIPNTLTLKEVLAEMKRFYPNWDETLANNLFNYFGFSGESYHSKLSKGKKSTFNMIVGLSAYTLLTIFDEPMTGMDESVRKDMYRAILKNYLEKPRIMIISSHHLDEIESLLENIILLDEGKLLFDGELDAFKAYAIGLTGKSAVLGQWAQSKDLLYRERVGMDDVYVVIKNNVSQEELEVYSREQSLVSASDLLVYLTNKQTGVIDDAFRTNGD